MCEERTRNGLIFKLSKCSSVVLQRNGHTRNFFETEIICESLDCVGNPYMLKLPSQFHILQPLLLMLLEQLKGQIVIQSEYRNYCDKVIIHMRHVITKLERNITFQMTHGMTFSSKKSSKVPSPSFRSHKLWSRIWIRPPCCVI